MVVLFGSNFPERLYVRSALMSFFGIGADVCARIMARHYIHKTARMDWLTNRHIVDLNGDLSGLHIENHLKREINSNIERLRDMKSYRGLRHAFNLPVRGQRTRGQIATATRLNTIPRHKLA